MGRRIVAIGEQFQELGIGYLGKRAPVWVVEETFTKPDELQYAKLICVADASLRKTLSIAVLAIGGVSHGCALRNSSRR